MACVLRQVVRALFGFGLFAMAAFVTIAAPFALSGLPRPPQDSSKKKSLHLPDSLLDKINAYLHRILEIVPDADQDHLFSVIHATLLKSEGMSIDRVLDIFLDTKQDESELKAVEDDRHNACNDV
ncbi:hypothetical protein H0H92_015463 [Tricholoma furcatifolium]|nr:hypothetical protein H0H92_015463 [Tricholoma furcatifolium]